MMRTIPAFVTGVAALSLLATPALPATNDTAISPAEASQPVAPVSISALVQANNQFAFDFFHQTSPNPDENAFFSPYSISTALAMTWAGAQGETASQMAKVLHYADWKVKDVATAYTALQQGLAKTQKESGAELDLANSLWSE